MFRRSPEAIASFQRRFMWITALPSPRLRIYENIANEFQLEAAGTHTRGAALPFCTAIFCPCRGSPCACECGAGE